MAADTLAESEGGILKRYLILGLCLAALSTSANSETGNQSIGSGFVFAPCAAVGIGSSLTSGVKIRAGYQIKRVQFSLVTNMGIGKRYDYDFSISRVSNIYTIK
jgi:hypothetical protein